MANAENEVDPLHPCDDLDADAEVSLVDTTEGEAAARQEEAGIDDPELEAIKARFKEMEEEREKCKAMLQNGVLKINMSSPPMLLGFPTMEEIKKEMDRRSACAGNVDYGTTAEELEQHFHGCGSLNSITLQCDKYAGHPEGPSTSTTNRGGRRSGRRGRRGNGRNSPRGRGRGRYSQNSPY